MEAKGLLRLNSYHSWDTRSQLAYLIDTNFNNIVDNNSLTENSDLDVVDDRTTGKAFHEVLFYRHAVLASFFCIYTLFFVLTTGLYWHYRKEYSIMVRSVSLSVSTVLAGFGVMCAYFTLEMEVPMPCFINLWIFNLCGALWITCFSVRAYRLVILTFYNAKVMALTEEQQLFSETRRRAANPELRLESSFNLFDKNLVSDKQLWRIVLVILGAMAAWTLIVQLASNNYPIDLEHCEPHCGGILEFFHVYLWTGLNVFVGFPVILYLLEKCGEDGFGIRKDTIISIVGALPLYVAYSIYLVVANVGSATSKSLRQSMFSPSYFILGAVILFHITSILLPLIRALRERYCVSVKQGYDFSYPSFIRTLQTPILFKEFKAYLLADFCAENAMFYEAYLRLYREIQCRMDSLDSLSVAPSDHPRKPLNFSNNALDQGRSVSHRQNPRRLTLIGDLIKSVREPALLYKSEDESLVGRFPTSALNSCVNDFSIDPLIWALEESAQSCARSTLFREIPMPIETRGNCDHVLQPSGNLNHSRSAPDSDCIPTPTNSVFESQSHCIFQDLAPVYQRLYSMFIKPRAPFQLNISASVSQPVADAINSGVWSLDLYDETLEHILELMFENTFSRYTRDKIKQHKLNHMNASKHAIAVERAQKFTAEYGDSLSSEFMCSIFGHISLPPPSPAGEAS